MIFKKTGVKNLLVLLFLAVGPPLIAQEISGLVLDGKTGEALVGASVYFDGSSLGTTTGREGRFHLKSPYKTHAPLIVSFLGYKSVRIAKPSQEEELNITMEEYAQPIPEIILTSDPFTRKQKLAVFTKEFLGDDRAARHCSILNEEVLSLSFNSYNNTFTATARAPLFIVNSYLGYVVHFDLREFSILFRTKRLKRTDNIIYTRYAGFSRFEDVSEVGTRLLKRRRKAYLGSPMHFMRSLWRGDLVEQGFSLKYDGESIVPAQIIQRLDQDSTGFKSFAFKKKNLTVYYLNRSSFRSSLRLEGSASFSIDRYGNYTPYKNLIFSGYMADLRIADMVPINYQPR